MKDKNEIGFKVRMLSNLIKRDIQKEKDEQGLSLPKGIGGWAISYFFDHRNENIFQKDFEAEFSIRRSTASDILKTMEQNGLIIRTSVERDLRLKKIILTEKAINIHKTVLNNIAKREERLKSGLSQDEINNFLSITDKIIANMEDSND